MKKYIKLQKKISHKGAASYLGGGEGTSVEFCEFCGF